MDEPVDVFSDQFQINIGPYGCSMNFMASDPAPVAPGTPPQFKRLACVRMSVEHLKVMTFILHRQITKAEQQTGMVIQIPGQVLNSLQIARDDWDPFWKA